MTEGSSGGCGSSIPNKISLRNHRIIIEERIDTGEQKKKKEIVYSARTV